VAADRILFVLILVDHIPAEFQVAAVHTLFVPILAEFPTTALEDQIHIQIVAQEFSSNLALDNQPEIAAVHQNSYLVGVSVELLDQVAKCQWYLHQGCRFCCRRLS
jgi:hypothetical protein